MKDIYLILTVQGVITGLNGKMHLTHSDSTWYLEIFKKMLDIIFTMMMEFV